MLEERLSALWKAREERACGQIDRFIRRLGLTAAPIPLAPIALLCRVQKVVFATHAGIRCDRACRRRFYDLREL